MSIQAQRKERENNQSLIRRFSRKVQQSGVLVIARKTRYQRKPKSDKMKKIAALRREELKKEYEKLRKFGK